MADAPLVISETIQEWRGVRYYRMDGRYFGHIGHPRLHRRVWMDVHGAIPKGWHVHHRDGDPANNHPDNLEILPATRHLSAHSASPRDRQREARRRNMAIASAARLAKPEQPYTCVECGAVFMARPATHPRKYCSQACCSRFHERGRPPRREREASRLRTGI